MYAWIWRHLPGPIPVKVITSIVIVALVIFVLFSWIFPWVQDNFLQPAVTVN